MQVNALKVILAGICIFLSSSAAFGHELKTRYITIIYDSEDQLRKFSREISLGSLSYFLKDKKGVTAEDEIKNKMDFTVERVESILEMYPKNVKFSIALLSSAKEVREIFRSKYGKKVDYIAFYSPRDRTIFVSVKDAELEVLAHEIAHVIIDFYYGVSTPTKIHEVLAQYVEEHLKD